MKLDLENTTFCSGLWIIPNGTKKTHDDYIKLLPKSLKMIRGSNLFFFYNNKNIKDIVSRCAENYDINLKLIKIELNELPSYSYADKFINNCELMGLDQFPRPTLYCKEKGVIHYWREYKDGGPDVYLKMNSIWLSKVFLVSDYCIADNVFKTDNFAWIDASVSRFNSKRINWKFQNLHVQPDGIHHYDSGMRYFGRKLPINASFLYGNKKCWGDLRKLYMDTMDKSVNSAYAFDDEVILGLCHEQMPFLFKEIARNNIIRLITKSIVSFAHKL